jgi:hypothetical protein
VYKNQFKYDKAEDMFLHALDMSERLLGKAHPHVLNRCVLPMAMASQPSWVKPTADQSHHDLFSAVCPSDLQVQQPVGLLREVGSRRQSG